MYAPSAQHALRLREPRSTSSPRSQRWVAWELRVGQPRAAILAAVSPDRFRRRKQGGAASSDDVILIDAIPAHPNCADQHTVAVKRKAAGENRNAVRQIRINVGRGGEDRAVDGVGCDDRTGGDDRESFLQSEKQSRLRSPDARRERALRKRADRARRVSTVGRRKKQSGARLLRRDIPTEPRR